MDATTLALSPAAGPGLAIAIFAVLAIAAAASPWRAA
jgi:hypothetical protein